MIDADESPGDGTMHGLVSDVFAPLAPATYAHALLLLSTDAPARRFAIGATPLSIGRVAPADIVLDGAGVSRRHCRLEQIGDFVQLVDLGSTNGCFVDAERVSGTVTLTDGAQLQVGTHVLRYERRRQAEMEAAQQVERDLARAQRYVEALLPAPIDAGPVHANWHFQPCALLGGDAFGYQMIGTDWFVAYILDVAGHGAGAAMHSVSVMNVLRQRALPGTDMRDPAAVLAGLNAMFDMDTHHGLFFTIWYGSYHLPSRMLAYGSAGHHAGLLRAAANSPDITELGQRNPPIGTQPEATFVAQRVRITPGNRLYLFSDGAFEIVPREGPAWRWRTMTDMLRRPAIAGVSEPARLYRLARAAASPGPLDDDFSVLELCFQ